MVLILSISAAPPPVSYNNPGNLTALLLPCHVLIAGKPFIQCDYRNVKPTVLPEPYSREYINTCQHQSRISWLRALLQAAIVAMLYLPMAAEPRWTG